MCTLANSIFWENEEINCKSKDNIICLVHIESPCCAIKSVLYIKSKQTKKSI